MSLRDGSKKMSKSDPSDYSRITMTDGPDEIAQKIRKAKTDPQPLPESVEGFEGRPEAANLITIYAALADMETEVVLAEHGGRQFSDFKKALTELAVEKLGPVGSEMQRLMADPAHVDGVLKDGAERAEALARPILREVYEAVGFLNVR
jgi:tryptophanyl-tRNA synthetase